MRKSNLLLVSFAMVAASVWLPAPGFAAESDTTVRLLVPASSSLRSLNSEQAGEWDRIEVPATGSVSETLETARREFGDGVVVERLYHLTAPQDEPLFDQQWHLRNTGQTGGTSGADINATRAWSVATGAGVVVAVVDSGVDATHPDLTGQVVQGWDYVDEDSDPRPVGSGDDEAHGSLVAGVIAAAANGQGITGVAPSARILNMRACSGGDCWSYDIARSIVYAVEAGADIVNLSLGSPGIDDPPLEAAIDFARRRGVLVVAAAGNESQDIDDLPGGEIMIPASLPFPNIVSVAASNDRDRVASFSNFGQSVDVFAPGEQIGTTDGPGTDQYVYVDGTSFSAPVVAGVAALLLSHDPGIGYQELKARLLAFTDNPSALRGFAAHGRIDAGKVLTRRFIDTNGSVFENTIKWLADQNITEGCNPPDNHRYCPSDNVTRGQMAVFFSRAFGLASTSTDYFNDDSGAFYENAANRMAAAGISVGCDTRRYCGERSITRGEMSAMLSRVLSLPRSNRNFFKDDNGTTFEGAINRIAEAEITLGCNPPANDRFCPDRNVTRGQMAAFIQRSVNLAG